LKLCVPSWFSSNLASSAAQPYQYRAYCLSLDGEPKATGGTGVQLSECATRYGAEGASGTDLQRFKYGYDYTGDWNDAVGSNQIWTNALNGSDLPPWSIPLTIVLAGNPLYCLDACAKSVKTRACASNYANKGAVQLNVCTHGRHSQKVKLYFIGGTGKKV